MAIVTAVQTLHAGLTSAAAPLSLAGPTAPADGPFAAAADSGIERKITGISPARSPVCDLSYLSRLLDDKPSNSWVEIPRSRMRPVLVGRFDPAMPEGVWGITGSEAVIANWNGGAFDGCRWYFVGGGHMAYGGNEVYRFDMASLAWSRLTEPTPFKPANRQLPCTGTTDRSRPVAGQSYDGLVIAPGSGALLVWANTPFCDEWGTFRGAREADPQSGRHEVWKFDPQHAVWTALGPSPEGWHFPKTATVPATGEIVYCRVRWCRLFDPETQRYHGRSPNPAFAGRLHAGAAAYDPVRSQVVILGRSRIFAAKHAPGRMGPVQLVATDDTLGDLNRFGFDFDPRRGVFVLWDGGGDVFTLDPATWRFGKLPTRPGSAPQSATRGVFGRWAYVAALDAFVGMDNVDQGFWLYRTGTVPIPPAQRPEITVCAAAGTCSTYRRMDRAFAAAAEGATITLSPGRYDETITLDRPSLTLRGEIGANGQRAQIVVTEMAGAGAITVGAPQVTIEGIECAFVPAERTDAACIRVEAADATLRDVYLHDNQSAVRSIAGGVLTIEESLFRRNGETRRASAIDVLDPQTILTFRRNRIESTRGGQYALRSHAGENRIEGNRFADLYWNAGPAVTLPADSRSTIVDNIFERGPNADAQPLIELRQARPDAAASVAVVDNLFIFDRPALPLAARNSGAARFENNRLVGTISGDRAPWQDGNTLLGSRSEANIPSFPFLPVPVVRR
jgi:hypothetical protein